MLDSDLLHPFAFWSFLVLFGSFHRRNGELQDIPLLAVRNMSLKLMRAFQMPGALEAHGKRHPTLVGLCQNMSEMYQNTRVPCRRSICRFSLVRNLHTDLIRVSFLCVGASNLLRTLQISKSEVNFFGNLQKPFCAWSEEGIDLEDFTCVRVVK